MNIITANPTAIKVNKCSQDDERQRIPLSRILLIASRFISGFEHLSIFKERKPPALVYKALKRKQSVLNFTYKTQPDWLINPLSA